MLDLGFGMSHVWHRQPWSHCGRDRNGEPWLILLEEQHLKSGETRATPGEPSECRESEHDVCMPNRARSSQEKQRIDNPCEEFDDAYSTS